MASAQPTTPKTPKNAISYGAPIGTKKTSPKKAAPKPEEIKNTLENEGEEPSAPIPGDDDGDDGKVEKAKPEAEELDEAIDLKDNAEPEKDVEEKTNIEEPSEIDGETPENDTVDLENPEEEIPESEVPEEVNPDDEKLDEVDPDDAKLDDVKPDDEKLDEVKPDDEKLDGDKLDEKVEDADEKLPTDALDFKLLDGMTVNKAGNIVNEEGEVVGKLIEGDPKKLLGKKSDAEGRIFDDSGNVIGKAEPLPSDEQPTEALDFSILEGKKVNKAGKIVDENGNPFGILIEGDPKKLAGKKVDAEGNIWNDSGKVIGKAEPIPADEREPTSTSPFEDFPDAVVDASGKILFEGRKIGIVTEGNPKELAGKKVDADGDILDKNGNVIGKSIREDDEEPEPEPEPEPEKIDCSALAGLKVNKSGNLVTESGNLVGRVVEGSLKSLIGKTCDAEGNIHNDVGKIIGRAEPIPENEREERNESPFEDFPGSIVDKSGNVLYQDKIIGKVIEGDIKKLVGKQVDPDGDILDKSGTVIGKAERWEEEEEPPAPDVDKSILAGKRVNKAGNVVDSSGTIYGKLVEGDVKSLAGRMCDKFGFVRNESGDVVGKAELVSEGDREGLKTGPFADFSGCTIDKDGKVVCDQGIVGRLIEGDAKKLFGKTVDEDGDVLDKNGNVVGKAERWEEEEVKKDVNPMSGLKVNKKGEVYDSSGELVGKLTEGIATRCAGHTIDDDGDVVDQKGVAIGHVTLIGDIEEEPEPEPEETETEEEKEKRLQAEQDKKLAIQLSRVIQSSLDQIQPVLKNITSAIETAERKPKEELDEQKLVDEVKPMIEEGGRILTEANGAIRGLDPDGRIQANAKHAAASSEGTPEEHHLADLLKELTGSVTQTIDNAKKKIAGMPHAKKELNPLWGLLAEPLFQILAAVGLLLSGVLGLVAQLLNGLGLGGLVRGLLGGLGITRVLDGLGLGKMLSPITGSKK